MGIFRHNFSVVVITRNEADNIGPCLNALLQVSNDVWVADSHSTDATPRIVRKKGAQLRSVEWKGYAATKNEANAWCQNDWILSIDADEVLSETLIQTLQNWEPRENTVYLLDRMTNYCGTWVRHSGWYPDWKPRLFDRRKVQWEGAFVHETLAIPSHFQHQKLPGKLWHYSYRSAEDHLQRIEKYARLWAEEQFSRGRKWSPWKAVLSPAWRFLQTYLLKGGWRDGKAGWLISTRNAWMVRRRYTLLKEQWAQITNSTPE